MTPASCTKRWCLQECSSQYAALPGLFYTLYNPADTPPYHLSAGKAGIMGAGVTVCVLDSTTAVIVYDMAQLGSPVAMTRPCTSRTSCPLLRRCFTNPADLKPCHASVSFLQELLLCTPSIHYISNSCSIKPTSTQCQICLRMLRSLPNASGSKSSASWLQVLTTVTFLSSALGQCGN